MNRTVKAAALLLAALLSLLSFACTGVEKPAADPGAAFSRILSEVAFAAPLEDNSEYAEFMFGELPEGTQIKMHAAGGQYVDTAILFTAPTEADIPAVRTAAEAYLASVKEEFRLYHPEEVPKLDDAVIYTAGSSLILVVTGDVETVNSILY